VDRLKSFDEERKESVEAELEKTFKTRKKSKEHHF